MVDLLIRKIVQPLYNHFLREHLPRKLTSLNGVTVRDARLLDRTDVRPHYKQGLINAIHNEVREGDEVTLIATGRGVSSVHCVRAGASRVETYEASSEMIDMARETFQLEGCSSQVSISQTVVGPTYNVYANEIGDVPTVQPSEMDVADILVLDCEGAENEILTGVESPPRASIIETHPEFVDTRKTRELVASLHAEVDEYQYHPDDEQPDKTVLVGRC